MSEVSASELGAAVERTHGGIATLVQSVPVREVHDGNEVWTGVVHVVDLAGHPSATRAYAWSSVVRGSDRRRFYAVLNIGPIDSPQAAVRAAVVAEYHHKSGER